MAEATPPAASRPRPLSPHLQIYRWQWTMALSIAHRATGVFLASDASSGITGEVIYVDCGYNIMGF